MKNKHPFVIRIATQLNDGLYKVETKQFSAGFVVENGFIVRCTPILLGRIHYYKTIAKKIK